MKAFLILLLLSVVTFASEVYMLDFKMYSLHEKEKLVDLNSFKGKRIFLTFIKAECKWCDKQLKAFDKIAKGEHAKEMQVVVVTLGSDIKALKTKTEAIDFPVLIASEELLQSIGGVKITPYTLITDRRGNFDTKIIGYQDGEKIESIIYKAKGKK